MNSQTHGHGASRIGNDESDDNDDAEEEEEEEDVTSERGVEVDKSDDEELPDDSGNSRAGDKTEVLTESDNDDEQRAGTKADEDGGEQQGDADDKAEAKARQSLSPSQLEESISEMEMPYTTETPFGIFTLTELGTVLFDLEGYHDSEYIYPVGYKGRYDMRTKNSEELVSMYFEIRYDGRESGGPAFVVRESHLVPDSQSVTADPDTAWSKALQRTDKDWTWKPESAPAGCELFGLALPKVRGTIEHLSGADRCAQYGQTAGGASTSKVRRAAGGVANGGRAQFELERQQRKRQREQYRRRKVEEKEREERKVRTQQREQERSQINDIKEKQRVEALRRRQELQDMRDKRLQEIDQVREARRVEVENYRDQEKRLRELQRTAKMLAGRETLLDDLELMEIEANDDPEKHQPWNEELERPLPNPVHAEELVVKKDWDPRRGAARLPDHLLSEALEIFEFTSYFGDQISVKRLNWDEFEKALVSACCGLFHGLHVQLVRLLFFDLPGAESPFRGRPLNSLTWPELLRQYLLMLEREHISDGLESLSQTMQLKEAILLLEEECYEELPLEKRMQVLSLNLYLALETHTLRLYVDEMCELNAKCGTQKRESFQLLLREERTAGANMNALIRAEPNKGEQKPTASALDPSAHILSSEDFQEFVNDFQEALLTALKDGAGHFGPKGKFATEAQRALEVIGVTCKHLAQLGAETLEKGGAAKDCSTRKAQMLDMLRTKLCICAQGEKSEDWPAAVSDLLSEAQDAAILKQMTLEAKETSRKPPAACSAGSLLDVKKNPARRSEEEEEGEDGGEREEEEEEEEGEEEAEDDDTGEDDDEDEDDGQGIPQTDGAALQARGNRGARVRMPGVLWTSWDEHDADACMQVGGERETEEEGLEEMQSELVQEEKEIFESIPQVDGAGDREDAGGSGGGLHHLPGTVQLPMLMSPSAQRGLVAAAPAEGGLAQLLAQATPQQQPQLGSSAILASASHPQRTAQLQQQLLANANGHARALQQQMPQQLQLQLAAAALMGQQQQQQQQQIAAAARQQQQQQQQHAVRNLLTQLAASGLASGLAPQQALQLYMQATEFLKSLPYSGFTMCYIY